jgi:hypothetical protein
MLDWIIVGVVSSGSWRTGFRLPDAPLIMLFRIGLKES